MNAYELADAIEDWDSDGQWDTPAANMLRQQADRIAELEKKLQESALDYISVCSQADEHYARLQELEKDGKVCATCGGLVYDPVLKQTKPLTDEEIKEIWYDLYPLSSSSYWDDKREGLAELKFAKAILRKAQEK